jgi:hypothetical protein
MKNSAGIPECATVVNDDGEALNMAYCGPECPGSYVAEQCIEAKDGEGRGKRCVFPFNWDGIHTECRADNKCATSIDQSNSVKVESKQWGYCGVAGSCNKDECITVGGASVGETCKFPFRNPRTRELHWNCTTAPGAMSATAYSSAPWCATQTRNDDSMVSGYWGFCSKKCSQEVQNNCYVDNGKTLAESKRCIFPFIWEGIKYTQCVMIDQVPMCATYINSQGVVTSKSYLKPCGPSDSCNDYNEINGKVITVDYRNVGTYINNGTQNLNITFRFETGVEDTSTSSWNVQGSITAGFAAYGAKAEISVSAGIGGGSSSSSSSHAAHTLRYNCPPRHKIVLKQKVLVSGAFQYRSFDLVLLEQDIDNLQLGERSRDLTPKDYAENLESNDVE